jgi:hypothetical protein
MEVPASNDDPTASPNEESSFLASRQSRISANTAKAALREKSLAENSAASESITTFLQSFNARYQEAVEILEKLPRHTVTASQRTDTSTTLSNCVQTALKLRSDTAIASMYLNPFDVRMCEGKVDKILKDVEGIRKTAVPRTKFTFKSRRGLADGSVAQQNIQPVHVSAERTVTTDTSDAVGDAMTYSIEHTDLVGKRIVRQVSQGGAFSEQDMRLRNLQNCTMTLLDVYGCVRLQKLNNCTIYLGCVTGPLYVESVKNCRIFGASRQLRIHDTFDTEFYMHTASGPIIENCKGCGFGPDVVKYKGKDELLAKSGIMSINAGKNQSRDVQDFKWLKKQKSPNWWSIDVEGGKGVDRSECDVVDVETTAATARVAREVASAREAASEASGVPNNDGDDDDDDSEEEL